MGDGDLISFGQITFKYDTDDHRILVYRLKHQLEEEHETIALSDDDGEPLDIKPVKQEIKTENDTEETQSIDSFESHAVDNALGVGDEDDLVEGPGDMHDWNQAELFMDRLNFDQPNEDIDAAGPSTPLRPPETVPVPSNFVPNIELPDEIPITAKIKEEVGWNSYDYEKSLHRNDAPAQITDTIDLCSDDDEAVTSSSSISVGRADTNAIQQSRQKHKSRNETEWKFPDIEPKRIRIDKAPPAKKMANELPESEKNRLIDAVQLNPEFLKVRKINCCQVE